MFKALRRDYSIDLKIFVIIGLDRFVKSSWIACWHSALVKELKTTKHFLIQLNMDNKHKTSSFSILQE